MILGEQIYDVKNSCGLFANNILLLIAYSVFVPLYIFVSKISVQIYLYICVCVCVCVYIYTYSFEEGPRKLLFLKINGQNINSKLLQSFKTLCKKFDKQHHDFYYVVSQK